MMLLALAACAASGDSSASPSDGASPSMAPRSSALSFCDPVARPDLLAPDGSRVVLDGKWTVPASQNEYGDVIDAMVRQAGDCVWLVRVVQWYDDVGQLQDVGEFHGRLGSDFVIRGEFADVFPGFSFPGDPWTYGPIAFRIEFEGDQVFLVEDREPGEPAPGCSGAVGSCPDPIRLVRPPSDDAAEPSPS